MILMVAVVVCGPWTIAVLASHPVAPPDTTVLVLAVGASFAVLGLVCRVQLGAGSPSLMIGCLGVAWLLLLASASAVGSPAWGGAVVSTVVAAALAHLLLSLVPSQSPGTVRRMRAAAGYATASFAGLLTTGPPAVRTIGAGLVLLATASVFAVVVVRIRHHDRAAAGRTLPALLPASAALLAGVAAILTGLRGDPPPWLMHTLFGLIAATPVGFLITVARHALSQVNTSRARVLHAADVERRRIERDLHDGVQQHLVSATVLIDLLTRRLHNPYAASTLRTVTTILTGASHELRHICHHLHPTALADDGLDTALAELIWQLPLQVTLNGQAGPLPANTASAAYYVAAEALTNIVKHARATSAHIQLARGTTALGITITDDGRGGADPARGTGLRGLFDRVEAAGGRLDVRSGRPAGTVVEATIPCTS